jgi:hypothetical protein
MLRNGSSLLEICALQDEPLPGQKKERMDQLIYNSTDPAVQEQERQKREERQKEQRLKKERREKQQQQEKLAAEKRKSKKDVPAGQPKDMDAQTDILGGTSGKVMLGTHQVTVAPQLESQDSSSQLKWQERSTNGKPGPSVSRSAPEEMGKQVFIRVRLTLLPRSHPDRRLDTRACEQRASVELPSDLLRSYHQDQAGTLRQQLFRRFRQHRLCTSRY